MGDLKHKINIISDVGISRSEISSVYSDAPWYQKWIIKRRHCRECQEYREENFNCMVHCRVVFYFRRNIQDMWKEIKRALIKVFPWGVVAVFMLLDALRALGVIS
jgi:hypothetical protein